MALSLFTVRMRSTVNGADFVLDRIEAESPTAAEEFAYGYLPSIDLRRNDYTAHVEVKQELTEV